MKSRLALIVSLVCFLYPALGAAAEATLEIRDCQGSRSFQAAVPASSPSTLRLHVETDSDNVIAVLSPVETAASAGVHPDAIKSAVRMKLASFPGVEPGVWKLCFEPTELVVKDIAVESPQASTMTAVGVSAVGVAGGVVALAAHGHSSSKDGGDVLKQPVTNPVNAAGSSGSGGKSGKATSSAVANPCFIGDDVEPMSPFS